MLAAAAVVITAFVVTMWLLAIAGDAKPGTDQANARLNAVRTGLAAGAGAGAAVGLMLAFRRQHHQEIATDLTNHDATERRITELYTKAVEQLGNDKAPVRLGGLYALERLAQDNPAHRQTIVNVICAYLRMPFSPGAPTGKHEPEADEDLGEPATKSETKTHENGDTWQQERQVRLTAQRILAEHLRDERAKDKRSAKPSGQRFWPGVRLDLAGATLIDFNFVNGVTADVDFHGATFSGDAWFIEATFSGDARFDESTFDDAARFEGATFNGEARFDEAIFQGEARFDQATFNATAWFAWATFNRAVFAATFSDFAGFGGAAFNDEASFDHATFDGAVGFAGAAFNFVSFGRATFNGDAMFSDATFSGDAVFIDATFSDGERIFFHGSRVPSPDAEHVWPTGWCLEPDSSGGYTVARADEGLDTGLRPAVPSAAGTAGVREGQDGV